MFGPGVPVINIVQEEEAFDLESMASLEQEAGSKIIEDVSGKPGFKGTEAIPAALAAVKESNGPLTIFIRGHGNDSHAIDISINALGDVLLGRRAAGRSLTDVSIPISACESYNYSRGLMNYLINKGVSPSEMPVIITSANNEPFILCRPDVDFLAKSLSSGRRGRYIYDAEGI